MTEAKPETITILKSDYDQLIANQEKLNALNMAGVDNWEGYSYAMELLREQQVGADCERSEQSEGTEQ